MQMFGIMQMFCKLVGYQLFPLNGGVFLKIVTFERSAKKRLLFFDNIFYALVGDEFLT